MKKKTHDITGHGAGQALRSALRGIAVCSAALCLTAACSREDALSEPAAAGIYDGPLTIRADIEEMLETRATHEKGYLNGDETWVLSTKWKGLFFGDPPEPYLDLEYFEAKFSNGYGEFRDRNDSIVEIKWGNMITDWNWYTIGLDNGPTGWDYNGYPVNKYWVKEEDRVFVNFQPLGLLEKYKAQVEPEDGSMAQNDLIAGCYYDTEANSNNKRWITIPLRHLMSRVHVEITAPVIEDLAGQDVRVWMTHLAGKCYGMERPFNLSVGKKRSALLLDSIIPAKDGFSLANGGNYDPVFKDNLYLLGSAEESEKLYPVEGKEKTYRTHYLIMPPQTTHADATETDTLRPTLYIKIGDRTFAGMLPTDITVDKETKTFSEFEGGQNITLKVNIDGAPPAIDIEAMVRQWRDVGTGVLSTDRGGIRTADDFKSAVEAFNDYVAKGGMTWKPGTEKPEPLERYGDFTGSEFVFQFFGDFEEKTTTIPLASRIDKNWKEFFKVVLNGHTVYGVDGLEGSVDHSEELKEKMLSSD